ncbi:glutamate-5-semialdehyde dehydrogenase [Corallincola luteus]|uniref:Gamma-glutamyl phosphate reductase n=2 Tax=Corallincola luteus TaxID=1775177 RepID=A0ABY2AQF3_9GAMM|nr:glutamate-5-semialdehyde dehydrogenase [Corallincola luteus]TCI05252.1 glutamate-5-semialdehyde dehydrogenase [Corallincola luteus]
MSVLQTLGQQAKQASYELATASTRAKNKALMAIADGLVTHQTEILTANNKDIEAGRANGLAEALLDRLLLDESRLSAIAADVRSVAELADPVGEVIEGRLLENGLRLSRRRIPVGVMGVIYEARPNVTIDVAALALKTGNAAILRGGKETVYSNMVLTRVVQQALAAAELPMQAVQYIENPDRALVAELLRLDNYVDMIIPRGGAGLHKLCKEQSTIPVITGGIGICHLFADASADLEKVVDVVENAKVQRPSVCNALDTLLVHEAAAAELLPALAERLAQSGVELRACEQSLPLLTGSSANVHAAGAEDFDQEWLALILGIKVVADLEAALMHIREHSSEHSDGILTNDMANATAFVNGVTSSAVYVNASTRFTDGSQFGLGAEVAVSTQKLHARGPMGLVELTTYKWVIEGDYTVRS